MRQKIENRLQLTVEGADLTGATNLQLYLRQGVDLFFELTPEVTGVSESDTTLLAVVPFEIAKQLRRSGCLLQLAWTDGGGNPMATEVANVPVEALLKEAGYDPA